MKYFALLILFCAIQLTTLMSQEEEKAPPKKNSGLSIEERLKAYAPVEIRVNLDGLRIEEIQAIRLLINAAEVIDEIFWKQSSSDAIAIRDSLIIASMSKPAGNQPQSGQGNNPAKPGSSNASSSNSRIKEYQTRRKEAIERLKNTTLPHPSGQTEEKKVQPTGSNETKPVPKLSGKPQRENNSTIEASNEISYNPYLEYVRINYGPYDVLNDNERFVGEGASHRPEGGAFYPENIEKAKLIHIFSENEKKKKDFESQYTVIVFDGEDYKAIPYHQYYPEIKFVIENLEKAAKLPLDEDFRKYLMYRAKSLRIDKYFESDLAWMDVKDSDIDVIIGPIENYQDGLFNYKAAYEAIVMVRDHEATKDLQIFKKHIDYFEQKLPCDMKYIRNSVSGDNSQLNIVNVVYASGDCNKGTKTIAASLPNDPDVREKKGGKNIMFKNLMEAKFDKIVKPIAGVLLVDSLIENVDNRAFITFVTLHEVSHTLGRGYVYEHDTISVRKALLERYSAIEECKADILSIYNHKHLIELGVFDKAYAKKVMATYLAGLFRSLRFGSESAHGLANLIQFNYLREKGAIELNKAGKYSINEKRFFDVAGDLANAVLTIEATGNYSAAGDMLKKYAVMNDELEAAISKVADIPRDIDVKYMTDHLSNFDH